VLIKRAVVNNPNSFDVIDNVSFSSGVQVPESSSLFALLGFGSLGTASAINRQLSQGKKSKQDD